MHFPGRVVGREVQRREIVKIVFNVRPFGDLKTHRRERSRPLSSMVWLMGCTQPFPNPGAPAARHVYGSRRPNGRKFQSLVFQVCLYARRSSAAATSVLKNVEGLACRLAGVRAPCCPGPSSCAVMRPFLPSALTRTASSEAKSPAAPTLLLPACSSRSSFKSDPCLLHLVSNGVQVRSGDQDIQERGPTLWWPPQRLILFCGNRPAL